MTHPHLAIIIGDPAGIDPKIIIKVYVKLRSQIEASGLRLSIIGRGGVEEPSNTVGAKLEISDSKPARMAEPVFPRGR